MKTELNDKINPKEKISYLKIGITAFCVIAAVILFFFLIFKIDVLFSFLKRIFTILQPVVLGAIIAFLVNPMVNFFNKNISKLLNKIFKKENKFGKLSLGASIAISLLIFVLLISIFFYLVIPEFAETITSLINVIPGQFKVFSNWIINLMESNSAISDVLNKLFLSLEKWFQENIVSNATVYATYLASGVINIVNFVMDFLIGIIVAIYLLAGKKILKAQATKVLYAILSANKVEKVLDIMRKSDAIFTGFINGKLINALIIGILCFIGTSILKIPYVMLISVVIAVTDIIPIFGPYIGAIPCSVLILLYDPLKCLYFVIFIILLQAFDGNVIGPKILGESTGLSAFWVIVAIMLGGGLFGIIGMLIGVPVFAVLYHIIRIWINYMLRRKNLPATTDEYFSNAQNCEIATEIDGDNNEQEPVDEAK